MTDYVPPVSPTITFNFQTATYTPPVSPTIIFNFGGSSGGPANALNSNYMILLTM